MDQNSTTTEAFGVQLDRARDAPTRFAFATLVGSDRLWIRSRHRAPARFPPSDPCSRRVYLACGRATDWHLSVAHVVEPRVREPSIIGRY